MSAFMLGPVHGNSRFSLMLCQKTAYLLTGEFSKVQPITKRCYDYGLLEMDCFSALSKPVFIWVLEAVGVFESISIIDMSGIIT